MDHVEYLSKLGERACDKCDSLDEVRHTAYLVREALDRFERRGQVDGDAVRELRAIADRGVAHV